MSQLKPMRILPAVALASLLLLTACEQSGTSEAEESVLRVHDVSGLQVSQLDRKLNELLSREDLPLRGKVELLDETSLAVNAPRYVQEQLEELLSDLGHASRAEAKVINRPFRIHYWFLLMSPADQEGSLPLALSDTASAILDEFPGYSLSIQDYIESSFVSTSRSRLMVSANGTEIRQLEARATDAGIQIDATIVGPETPAGDFHPNYGIDQLLEPGKALVLGRVHGGGMGKQTVYQVLVARAEWTDSAD